MTRYRCYGCGKLGFSVKLCPRCGGSDTCAPLIEEPSDTMARYLTQAAALDFGAAQCAAKALSSLMTEPASIELGARAAHAAYVEHSRNLGYTSRVSANGEEQLVPYHALSEWARSYDRAVARAVIGAVLGVDVVLEQLLREEEEIERREGGERKRDLEALLELWLELTHRADAGDRGDLLCRLYGLEEGDEPGEVLIGLLTDLLAAADRFEQPAEELLSEAVIEWHRERGSEFSEAARCIKSVARDESGEMRVIFHPGTGLRQAARALMEVGE